MISLPKLAVRRPVTAAMAIVSVLVLGAIAVVKLPQASRKSRSRSPKSPDTHSPGPP